MSSIASSSSKNNDTTIVCIPGVFANIGEERIRRAFADLDIGEVIHVDIVEPKIINPETPKNKKVLNRVFVHLNLNTTSQAITLKNKLLQGKQIKIVYDQPWFWNISLYKKKEKAPEEPKQFKHKKATLKFEDEDEAEQSPPVTVVKQKPTAIVVVKQEPTISVVVKQEPTASVVVKQEVGNNYCSFCLDKDHIDGMCLLEDPSFFKPPKPIDYNLQGQSAPKRKTKIVIDKKKSGEK